MNSVGGRCDSAATLFDTVLGGRCPRSGSISGPCSLHPSVGLPALAFRRPGRFVVRFWSAWLGAGTLTLGFLAGLALCYPARIPDGSLAGLLRSVPPIVVAAALGYAVLGTLAVLARRVRCTPHECDGPPLG
jgi:hypothetical protein